MSYIECHELGKDYRVHLKEPGLMGSLRSLFYRRWQIKQAVKNVSFQIHPGEIVGLVGANGAGKTTLIKMLTGIVYPSQGQALVLGHNPWLRHNAFRSQMSLIMGQKASLWWDLPAADCFLLLKEIYQLADDVFEARLQRLSEQLEVNSLLNIQIRRLSLGERMKMELIAALLHNPKVIFLDEPTIGLDLRSQKSIRRFLLDYKEEHHPAIILTSHYMEDIAQVCERLLIMRQGELIFDGPLQQVLGSATHCKILSVYLENLEYHLPSDWGEVIHQREHEWKFKVPQEYLSQVISHLFSHGQVGDLKIEEVDIADVIEELMAGAKT